MMHTESVAVDRSGAAVGNAFVITAITTVGIGLGMAFHVQLGLPVAAATACAATLYSGLLILHISMMRRRKIVVLEQELARLMGERGPTKEAKARRTAGPSSEFRTLSAEPRHQPPPKVGVPELGQAVGVAGGRDFGPANVDLQAAILARNTPTVPRMQNWRASDAPAKENFAAPSYLPETVSETPIDRQIPASPKASAEPAPMLPGPRTLDANAIHAMVRKLAVEADANAQSPQSTGAQGGATVEADGYEPVAGVDPMMEPARALRTTANAMRAKTPEIKTGSRPAAVAKDTARADVKGRLALLAEALSAERIDVLLEPILELKGQATHHYEVSVSLRMADGIPFDPVEDRQMLGGTGILPLIDIAKMSRIAEVARRLAERGRTGSVFTTLTGESLGDDEFLTRFSDIYNERTAITEQLVIALAQADVRAFGPAHWSMVRDLGAVGFRFALEHVTDLDMDFEQLRDAGVQYVKLDAAVFLVGMPAGDGASVPAADIHRFMSDKDLDLIVGHIADETQLKHVMDCGVLYGQGQLFGGPRPVKAQVFQSRTAA